MKKTVLKKALIVTEHSPRPMVQQKRTARLSCADQPLDSVSQLPIIVSSRPIRPKFDVFRDIRFPALQNGPESPVRATPHDFELNSIANQDTKTRLEALSQSFNALNVSQMSMQLPKSQAVRRRVPQPIELLQFNAI